MEEKTLIIHGWSDCSDSFTGIKNFLNGNGIPAASIYYADYESREDNLTFNDIIDGLNDQLIKNGFIEASGKKLCDFNVIVHSTGGLVIRHWIWRYYGDRPNECPVKRIVMLAPANFGSPLAERGKSFLGQLFKGRWKIGDFLEVGQQILGGLELASPYQWDLTHKDLLISESYFNSGHIQVTVLVGIKDYTGLRGWVNKPGTDGTVVISGTPLSTIKLMLDLSLPKNKDGTHFPTEWKSSKSACDFAFGILPELDHGSIVDEAGNNNSKVSQLLLKALRIKEKNDFKGWQKDLSGISEETYRQTGKAKFQQFILHTVDDQGVHIPDFSVEFFVFKADRVTNKIVNHSDQDDILAGYELEYSSKIHNIICKNFTKHSSDSSFRRFLVDPEEVLGMLEQAKKAMGADVVLSMKIYVDEIEDKIGYYNDAIQKIVIHDTSEKPTEKKPSFFFPNTTTFIELKINRYNEYVYVGLETRKA